MNKDITKIINERNIHPIEYQKINKAYIIKSKDKTYVIKLNTNNYDIYKYLLSRDFSFFPENYSLSNDNYDISLFIDNLEICNEQRISDYIKLISLLHFKTSYNREINLDEVKEIYESINNKIINLRNYYIKLNDEIDHELFLSPSSYLLVRNISLIYSVLDNIDLLLIDIYKKLKNEKSIRVSLLHNNIDLNHLIINEEEYLISWDKSYFDNPIYELEKIFRKYYDIINLNDLINIYEKYNKLSLLEKRLLIINLSIPKKLLLTNDVYLDTDLINKEIKYLKKVYELLIKYRNEL